MAQTEGPPLSGQRAAHSVLVVEDDADIRESLVEALLIEGFDVLQAANGAEALRVLSQVPAPGIVLLDLMMPVMDGWQFLAARRADPALAQVPVAVVSAVGGGSPDEIVAALRKPVDLDRLVALVAEYCAR